MNETWKTRREKKIGEINEMKKEKNFKMFYGQNCSWRLGENKAVICVVGSKEDYKFAKLINELNLKNIKRDLTEKHFFRALEFAKSFGITISIVVIETNQFGEWRNKLLNYSAWFAKLYGIICYNAIKPILDKGYLQMDREYDDKTLDISAKVILKLTSNKIEIYTRKENEYPTNRIIVADLFARGYFKGFDCKNIIINKKPRFENEIKEIFKAR